MFSIIETKQPKNLYYYWFIAIIVFGCFDGIFLGTIFTFLPTVRTLLYLGLFVVTLLQYGFSKFRLNIWMKFFIVYLTIEGLIHFDEYALYNYLGLNFFIKNIFQIIILYCFAYYEKMTGHKIEELYRIIINTVTIWCIANFILYFVNIPIWGPQRHIWWGRIACGYPTVDVITLNFALIILLFTKIELPKGRILISSFLIIVSIMGQASGTGSFILICTLIYYAFCKLIESRFNVKLIMQMLVIIVVSVFLATNVAKMYKNYDSSMYDAAISILKDKYYGIVGQSKKISNFDTMDMREEVANRALKKQNSLTDKLFGLGFAQLDYSEGRSGWNSRYVMIENQYKVNQFSMGYIGHILFILAVYIGLLKIKIISTDKRRLLCIFFFMYAMSGLTTTTFVSFPIQVIFAIIYTLQNKYINKQID